MTWSVDAAMDAFKPVLPMGVAYSGGVDSSVLLHACVQRWPGQVVALHVNHNLQEAAPRFERHCADQARALGVPLVVASVQAQARPGQSPEDAARTARYQALQAMAAHGTHPVQSVALAQHADDQVETVLMALCRGAGVSGLRGMARHWVVEGIGYARPLIQVSRSDLEAWLLQHGIHAVEDPTNADQGFTRNAMRAQVLPAMGQVYPQFRDAVTRSARHMAQAQSLLDEVAQADWQSACISPSVDPVIARLQVFSEARLSNVLRYWLKQHYGTVPTQSQLSELMRVLRACTTRGHRIHLKVGRGFVQRQGPRLAWYNPSVLRTEN